MSPEEANLALLKANINDLALELEKKSDKIKYSKSFGYEVKTLNRIRAEELRNLASRLKEMI